MLNHAIPSDPYDRGMLRSQWVAKRAAELKAEYLADPQMVSEQAIEVLHWNPKYPNDRFALFLLQSMQSLMSGSDALAFQRLLKARIEAKLSERAQDDAETEAFENEQRSERA